MTYISPMASYLLKSPLYQAFRDQQGRTDVEGVKLGKNFGVSLHKNGKFFEENPPLRTRSILPWLVVTYSLVEGFLGNRHRKFSVIFAAFGTLQR